MTTNLESAHPYGNGTPALVAGGAARRGEITVVEIRHAGATYIAPHFAAFDFDEQDFVLVRSPDGARTWRYDGGPSARRPFWGISVPGPAAIIEIHRLSAGDRHGYRIDQYARGRTESEMASDPCRVMSICAPDDSGWAACYTSGEPSVYNRGRTVARLLINGLDACTAWLIGSQGHIMTNWHCIGTAADAANTQVEFVAEGATCGTNCGAPMACPGTVEAVTTTFIQADQLRDYALVKPNAVTNLATKYGYLQVRASGAIVKERIYIPQHPAGWGKRIAVLSTAAQDLSGFAEVSSLTEPACQPGGPSDIGYFADTQGASSGSPVLGYIDHRVVALHHCGNCPNRAVPIQDVISDLGANLPTCAVPTPGCPSNGLSGGPGGTECSSCGSDSDCSPPATCIDEKCVTASFSIGIGNFCCNDLQCQSHSCSSDGRCQCLSDADCPSGLTCVFGSSSNLCQTPAKAECEHCTFNKECAPGVCHGGLDRVCIVPHSKPVGGECCRDKQCISEKCGPFGTCECRRGSDCPSGFYCEHGLATGNACLVFKQKCDFCSADKQCAPGYHCDGKPLGRCITGNELLELGQSCCRDDQCKSGSCPTDNSLCQCAHKGDCPAGEYCALGILGIGKNSCVPFKAECDGCSSSSQCGPGALCKLGKCASGNSVGLGASCCRDYQCTTGSCNADGACQCTNNSQCPSGQYCALGLLGVGKNRCVSFKAECDDCVRNSQCGPGALCRLGKCATHNSLPKGASCCRDWQCTNGNCKANRKCN